MAKWIKRPQNYNQLFFDFLVILLMLETTYSFLPFSLRFRKKSYRKKGKVYSSEDVTRPAHISYLEVQILSKRISC